MAEAALTLAEIGASRLFPIASSHTDRSFAETLLSASEGVEPADDDPEALLPIRSLNAVESAVPSIELSRQLVVEEMESAVQRGLTDLVRPAALYLRLFQIDLSFRAGPPSPRLVPSNRPQPLRPPFSCRKPRQRPERPRLPQGESLLRHVFPRSRDGCQRCIPLFLPYLRLV